MKRILLVNPSPQESGIPNTGLALLSAVLRGKGHEVCIADYHFSHDTPPIEEILRDFHPDIAGISLFSCRVASSQGIINALARSGIPIAAGGPHAASYSEELLQDSRFDDVVVGEAEEAIAGWAENAAKRSRPMLVSGPLPDVDALPQPDYRSMYLYERLSTYPLLTSRGCPFNCSFCSIAKSNSKRWRPRSIETCIAELRSARGVFPRISSVMIWDDNFSLDLPRAKRFLQEYLREGFPWPVQVANVRADRIDKEFLGLLKRVGCEEIQFGVEHGDPEVFRLVGKKESLEDILRASSLVAECGLKLGCSFIIGLPHDSLARTYSSIVFARRLRADHVHWNVLVPYKGTAVYDYFKENGVVDDSHIPLTLPTSLKDFEPNAYTPDFTKEERQEALFIALLHCRDPLLLQDPLHTIRLLFKYKRCLEALRIVSRPRTLKRLLFFMAERLLRSRSFASTRR